MIVVNTSPERITDSFSCGQCLPKKITGSFHCGQHFSRENHRLALGALLLQRKSQTRTIVGNVSQMWAMLLPRESQIRTVVSNASPERITTLIIVDNASPEIITNSYYHTKHEPLTHCIVNFGPASIPDCR